MTSEIVVFRGVKYRRYPDSKNWAESSYFVAGIADRLKGRKRLHEDIWIDAHGSIPAGCHIHHRDHNPLNNDLTNLLCMTKEDHKDEHAEDRRGECSPERLALLDTIRPLAAEWHRTAEGLAWHAEHGRRSWDGRVYSEQVCDHCGVDYLTRASHGNERFCSNACKSAARRAAGLDTVERICAQCDAPYHVNRYSKGETCSKACGMKLSWKRRRTAP
jgi:hypothetical protein